METYYYKCFVRSSRWDWQRDILCLKIKEGKIDNSWEWKMPEGARPLPHVYLTNDESKLPSILEAWRPYLNKDASIPAYLEEAVLKNIFNAKKVTLMYD